MKQNQVCYYIEDSQFGMHVSYGIYEYKTTCTHKVSRLRPPEIRLINGIPFEEFQSETEFKKVPKGWTYSTDLYTVTENLDKKEKINAAMKGRYVTCPSDLQWLFDNGYLVKVPDVEEKIEVEFDHDRYRLLKKCPAWTLCYGQHNTEYPNKVFETYAEAEMYMEELKCNREKESALLSWVEFYETMEWALEKYEADHGGKEIEKIRQKLLDKPRAYDAVIRYYRGEILICSREEHRKNTHAEWTKVA